MTILQEVHKILEKEQFDCALSGSSSEFPFERLIVFLRLDGKKRERILEIFSNQQPFSQELMLPNAAELPCRLQFKVQLPFKIEDTALNQVASLLFYLNQMIDLPGFELHELEGEVVYRYVWLTDPTAIHPTLIMNIVGAIMLNLDLFAETIECLADGKISFNDLLSQIVKIADTAKTFSYTQNLQDLDTY